MIDLTPLDVRKKAGDFKRGLRGYDPEEVDGFLQLAAERLEELVKENLTLRERSERLQEQVAAHEERERAVQEALVVAQQLRVDLKAQAEREADLQKREAEAELARRMAEGTDRLEAMQRTLEGLDKRRRRFLRAFRTLLQRELEALEAEEAQPVHEGAAAPSPAAKHLPTSEEPVETSEKASPVTPTEAVEALSESPEARSDGGLWLSSILKEGAAPADVDDEGHVK